MAGTIILVGISLNKKSAALIFLSILVFEIIGRHRVIYILVVIYYSMAVGTYDPFLPNCLSPP